MRKQLRAPRAAGRHWPGRWGFAAALAGLAANPALSLLVGAPARADCTAVLSTVTCAPPGTGGFQAGVGVNNLTVTNSGSVIVGDFFTGIGVNNGNVVTNNGNILTGDGSFAIDGRDGNSVVNNGGITVGGLQAAGIQVRDNNPSVVNNGTIIAGDTSPGIVARDGNTIVNNGTIITANDSSFSSGAGILIRDGNTVINNGTIIAGDSNGGLGPAGVGLGIALGSNNTIINTGRIIAGASGISILMGPSGTTDNNTILNSGTMDGRLFLMGSGNTLTNSGLITITNPATPPSFHVFDGTFVQTASGTLALRVTPDTTFLTGYDSLSVSLMAPTDKLQLGGTLRAVLQQGNYQNTQTYLSVVSLCGCSINPIEGRFAQVVSSSPFYAATATYSATSVDLTLTRMPFGSVPGLTPNQQAVGTAIESAFPGGNAAFYDALFFSSSSQVLSQISGEGTLAAQNASFLAGGQFNMTMMQQSAGGDAGPSAPDMQALGYAPQRGVAHSGAEAFAAMPLRRADPSPWRVWASAFAARQTLAGDNGSFGQSQRLAGGMLGLERQASFDLRYGVALGASQSSFSSDNTGVSGRFDAAHLGVYSRKNFGATYLTALASYTHFWNRTSRSITLTPAPESTSGAFGADLVSGRVEYGYRHAFANFQVTPFVAIEPSMLWQRGYTETTTTGAGLFPLSFSSTTTFSFPTFLGAQFDTQIPLGDQMLTPYLRASWVHEFSPDRKVQAAFLTLPGASFTVAGPRAARDAARIEAGARWTITRQALLFANLTGEFSDRSQGYTANGGLRINW